MSEQVWKIKDKVNLKTFDKCNGKMYQQKKNCAFICNIKTNKILYIHDRE